MGPLMEQGLEKAKTAAIFVSENTTQFILWVKEKTPQAIEWVSLYTNGCKTATSCSLIRSSLDETYQIISLESKS